MLYINKIGGILMQILFKKKVTIIAFTLIVLIGLFIALNNIAQKSSSKTVVLHPSYVSDFSDDSALVGFAQNVFIGEIVSEKGNKKLSEYPETQFNVKVIENIKGNLSGTVIVNQEGGYLDKTLYVVENDTMLKQGKKYLFATRYNKAENFHTVIPVNGKVNIDSNEKIKDFSDRFKNAYKQAKYFDETKGEKIKE
jgi:hypothetical protein